MRHWKLENGSNVEINISNENEVKGWIKVDILSIYRLCLCLIFSLGMEKQLLMILDYVIKLFLIKD